MLHRSVHYSQDDALINGLAGRVAGEVLVPGAPGYESARKPAMARFHDIRPRAVVMCASAADVVETLAFARRSGIHIAPRSGGHSIAGLSSTRGIVIDVTPMRSVSVSGGVATVGAGARLGDLYDALHEHGLTIPAGCGPSVGIAGLTLGGGVGILGRKYGLTSDHLLAAQVVLADGRVVECDDDHHEELFWALRGAGGGKFGVVTTLVFRTVPAPAATCFHLVWPLAQAAAVIDAWQAWAPTAPDELDASLLLTATGDPDRPPVANLLGAMHGSEADTAELLGELVARAGVDPASASHRRMSYREAKRYLAELGDQLGESSQEEGLLFSKSEFFRRRLPTETIVALVENLSRELVPEQSRHLDFLPWGGAYNRARADATAFVHRNEQFLVQHLLVVDPHASTTETERARDWLTRAWALAHPWGSGHVYPNFPDPDLENPGHAYYGTNYDRLLHVKRTYDPDSLFRFAEQSL
jgi:FAD/FMN-containing dehydrogenase